ncbi:MAG: SMI1/KNR4 family protein [Planctomycetota bacterium]
MRKLDDLLAQVRAEWTLGGKTDPAALAAARQRYRLPSGLVAFYEVVGDGGWAIEYESGVQPLERLRPPAFLPPGTKLNWLDFYDVADGNCVGLDMDSVRGDSCTVIDVFHETAGEPGYSMVIALSFTEFLERMLAAGGRNYWLEESFNGYGDAFESSEATSANVGTQDARALNVASSAAQTHGSGSEVLSMTLECMRLLDS